MKNRKNLISFKRLHKDWMKNPEFKTEYKKLEPEFQIAKQIIAARLKQKISQEELAKKVGTDQAIVSRLENMVGKPSIFLLERFARALNIQLNITIN